jgi:hypothetical protein
MENDSTRKQNHSAPSCPVAVSVLTRTVPAAAAGGQGSGSARRMPATGSGKGGGSEAGTPHAPRSSSVGEAAREDEPDEASEDRMCRGCAWQCELTNSDG